MTSYPQASFVERARKTVVAAIGVAATIGTVLATADLSTLEGVVATAIGVATVLGVYHAPNRP